MVFFPLQATIREKFADCTVLTIAHRLNTIMDSDRILVMDAGEIAEFDEPHLLMQREDSIFLSIVNQTGPATTALLKNMALQAYLQRRKQARVKKAVERKEQRANGDVAALLSPEILVDDAGASLITAPPEIRVDEARDELVESANHVNA